MKNIKERVLLFVCLIDFCFFVFSIKRGGRGRQNNCGFDLGLLFPW